MASVKKQVPILSTAGAVPVKNEKGDIAMEKVKVSRYVSGKRPDYAPESSDEEEQTEFGLNKPTRTRTSQLPEVKTEAEKDDRRLKRLQGRQQEEIDSDEDREARVMRHRRLVEPEVVATKSDDDDDGDDDEKDDYRIGRDIDSGGETSEEEEELDDEEIERRRELLRLKAREAKTEEEVLDVEEEKEQSGEEGEEQAESSEYEEYSGSEEEDLGPRLKPVFVPKKNRITIQEKEKEVQKQKELEQEAKRLASERRMQTLRMVELEVRKELERDKKSEDPTEAVKTDDENEEEAYEAWKVRELRRLKRDREERENLDKEKAEVERLRNLTEEERRMELKNNPKQVTNKAPKGKYKFLQKYYHRGVFFLNEDDTVYKRDFTAPTLEDHFDKTVLPKVMQVKNFGRSGRTKYTHLVDQDTTQFESPWIADTAMNLKFLTSKGGGMKQSFERPTVKKRK